MNKKGFTLIELITTFLLAVVIIILLLNIISIIKNIYQKNDIKSKLSLEQSNLSNIINKKFDNGLKEYNPCDDSDFCYEFEFDDGSSSKLLVKNNRLRFDSYNYDFGNIAKISDYEILIEEVDIDDVNNKDAFLVIKLPIKSKQFPDMDFGIDFVTPYTIE